MSEYINENTVIEDYPILVLPKLAVAIGLEEAMVVQQLYWLLKNPANGKNLDGEKWIFNTAQQWVDQYFPFWCISTVKRTFQQLERMGLVMSCQPEGKMSRRKYYRLNRGGMQLLKSGKIQKPKKRSRWDSREDQLDPFDDSSGPLPITETSSREYSLKKTSLCEREEVIIPAEWKPTSKETQLLYLNTPDNYPSQWDFDEFLAESCEHLADKRGDLYLDLCNRKWHHWNQRNNKWTPIKDWQSYVLALEEKVSHSTTR